MALRQPRIKAALLLMVVLATVALGGVGTSKMSDPPPQPDSEALDMAAPSAAAVSQQPPPTDTSWTRHFGSGPVDRIDFCCCSASQVNSQAPQLLALLDSLVRRPFFRFLRVNVHKPCPYYAVSLLCTTAHSPCDVCKCDAESIPKALHAAGDMSELPSDYSDEPLAGRSAVPTSVAGWGGSLFDGLVDDHGHESVRDSGAEYVDLVRNPEGHTGYSGPLAARIWDGIYKDNCVVGVDGVPECSERIVLYRLISGLHSSISTHIAITWNSFVPDGIPDPPGSGRRGLNCVELRRRVLDHNDRVENLHMLYQFVLRAVTRAADAFLRDASIYASGDAAEDAAVWSEVQALFRVKLLCANTFNESTLLGRPDSRGVVAQMRRLMRNVTTLTDCISCEKCRVWGKLQFLGLATALKVVTHEGHDVPIVLARNEMVALINLLRQLSVSVDAVAGRCDAHGVEGSIAATRDEL